MSLVTTPNASPQFTLLWELPGASWTLCCGYRLLIHLSGFLLDSCSHTSLGSNNYDFSLLSSMGVLKQWSRHLPWLGFLITFWCFLNPTSILFKILSYCLSVSNNRNYLKAAQDFLWLMLNVFNLANILEKKQQGAANILCPLLLKRMSKQTEGEEHRKPLNPVAEAKVPPHLLTKRSDIGDRGRQGHNSPKNTAGIPLLHLAWARGSSLMPCIHSLPPLRGNFLRAHG